MLRHWSIARSFRFGYALPGSDEPVPATWQRFDEPRVLGAVAQGVAELVDSCVEAFFELHSRIGPDCAAQFLPRHDVAAAFQQQRKHPKWLLLKPDLRSAFAQLAGAQVELERPEPDECSGGSRRDVHVLPSMTESSMQAGAPKPIRRMSSSPNLLPPLGFAGSAGGQPEIRCEPWTRSRRTRYGAGRTRVRGDRR